eukprot:83657-Rhodomonas_salina.1
MMLRFRYAMSGTDLAYACYRHATRCPVNASYVPTIDSVATSVLLPYAFPRRCPVLTSRYHPSAMQCATSAVCCYAYAGTKSLVCCYQLYAQAAVLQRISDAPPDQVPDPRA